jgi:predicted TIM-barrel fold metal-dependent hydrolase
VTQIRNPERATVDSEAHIAGTGSPYLIISADGHVGPSLKKELRPYCPERYLADFDDFAAAASRTAQENEKIISARDPRGATVRDLGLEALAYARDCGGLHDPRARLRDMDADGITADVIFAGGQNDEPLPFIGMGFDAGLSNVSRELREVGERIFNRWLADYISAHPHRLLGVMQLPIWDPDKAVRELEWGRSVGLRVANLPAPRSDYPPYTEEVYEPFWAACDDLGVSLATHVGGGERPLGASNKRGDLLHLAEMHWLSRRGVWQLIFGGVFERHPTLNFVATEQRVDWVPDTLRQLDSGYENIVGERRPGGAALIPSRPSILQGVSISDDPNDAESLPRRPSDYWASNCYLSGSFLAPYEAEMRHKVGLRNLMWGSDYPHCEGTWPYTRLSLRNTFAGMPEDEVRMILGENALRAYHLDAEVLLPIAEAIGPRPLDLAEPLSPEEIPARRGYAWRELGAFS